MTRLQHGLIVVVLMVCAGVLLVWKASRAAILYADGIRYIRQAVLLEAGELDAGLIDSIDHPLYPILIAGAHSDAADSSPESWQRAGQLASIVSGVMLVIPLYLLYCRLGGIHRAWIGVVLAFLCPVTTTVFADVLSESTFLLCWTWGLWFALRFLSEGRFGWLPLMVIASAAAYLTRPEGLLLPGVMILTLAVMPLMRATRLHWPRWAAAISFLVLGPLLVVGPYIHSKGGFDTKPAVARIFGTAAVSGPDAVERSRPLESGESVFRSYAVGLKEVYRSIRDGLTFPLLCLLPIGFYVLRREGDAVPRIVLFMTVLLAVSILGLVRLYATGGYCSSRHALIPILILVPVASVGLDGLLQMIRIPRRIQGKWDQSTRLGPIFWPIAIVLLTLPSLGRLQQPLNMAHIGYRVAADWLLENRSPGETVVDPVGWTLFYGTFDGYTFADMIYAGADQSARWVVAREAHVFGPWEYCRQIRSLIGNEPPVVVLPPGAGPEHSRVYIFDRKLVGRTLLNGTPELQFSSAREHGQTANLE